MPCTSFTRNSSLPSSSRIRSPARTSLCRLRYCEGMSPALPITGRVVTVTVFPVLISMLPSSKRPTRIFGPHKSSRIAMCRPARFAARLTRRTVRLCVSASPCDIFTRTTLIPAEISFSIMGSDAVAGPSVAMILVLRQRNAVALRSVIFRSIPYHINSKATLIRLPGKAASAPWPQAAGFCRGAIYVQV